MTDRLTEKEIEEIWDRYESATDARGLPPVLTDIPRLLDEVERLREERDRYRRDIKSALERIDTPRLLDEARDHDVQMAANKMRRMLNE